VTRRRAIALLLAAIAAVGLVDLGGADLAAAAPPRRAAEPDGRILVLAVPTLAWGDLYQGRTPNLDQLLDGSAVAALSVRDVVRTTSPADGYAALSAGTRARGVGTSGEVLEPDEDFFGVPAGEVFRRNTGVEPGGGVVSLAQPQVVRRNNRLHFDAEVGALGQALEDAGVPRAVIANADGRYALGSPTFDRVGGSALADATGVVPAGRVSRDLVEEDPLSPFGVHYDQPAVLRAFDEVWSAGGVVLVEGSDLARADRYRSMATSAQQARLRNDALASTDALVGKLLERVDLERDTVLVVGPYHSSAGSHLTVAGLHAPGVRPGLLRSATTRRAGFVQLVDVAPTILERAGVERPDSMEGRPFERTTRGPATGAQRAAELARINRQAKYRDHMVAPVATLFVALSAALLVAAAVATWRGVRRRTGWVAFGALAMLGYLPATYVAGRLPFYRWGDGPYYAFVLAVALAVAGGCTLVGRRHRLDPLLLALGAVFGLLVVDMLLGAPLQINAVFGYSPTVGGRFAGMGNLAYGQFAGAAFLLGGLLVHRIHARRRALAVGIGVLGLAVVIDGAPMWGSDVGGVLAFVPAIGITVSRLLRIPIRARLVALVGAATLAVIGAFAAIDLSRPTDSQTHLGRLVTSIADEGWGSLGTVVTRKLGANLSVITSTVWTAMVPLALALAVYLLWRAPGAARAIRSAIPECLAGLLVVGALGFALNDSGIAVPGVMIGVVNAGLVHLAVRGLAPEPGDDEPDAPAAAGAAPAALAGEP
jgi:hypothetical protein